MSENHKIEDWTYLNKSMLEMCRIVAFLYAIQGIENKPFNIFPNNSQHLDNIFLFFASISRIYGITELNKIINPHPASFTIFSFFNDNYPDKKSIEWRKFGEWKKTTKDIRDKISGARNRFSSHADKKSLREEENFNLFIEEIEKVLNKTLQLFDFLYEHDNILKSSFDKEICPAGPGSERPSQVSEDWKKIITMRVKSLQLCCG